MDVVAIPTKTLEFVTVWISSSLNLLFAPTDFMQRATQRTSRAESETTTIRTQLSFAASSALIAVTIFQLVARRHDLLSPSWDALTESVPQSLLIISLWALWSLLLAGTIRLFGGSKPPIQNMAFSIRIISTIYMISMVVGTSAFLSLGNKWEVFERFELGSSFLLHVIYFPLIFVKANHFVGVKLVAVTVVIIVAVSFLAAITLGTMISNRWFPPNSIML